MVIRIYFLNLSRQYIFVSFLRLNRTWFLMIFFYVNELCSNMERVVRSFLDVCLVFVIFLGLCLKWYVSVQLCAPRRRFPEMLTGWEGLNHCSLYPEFGDEKTVVSRYSSRTWSRSRTDLILGSHSFFSNTFTFLSLINNGNFRWLFLVLFNN